MDTLEICHFRFISCFYQCIESCFHQLSNAAAENCLFTEEVSFSFFFKGGFKNTCSACTDTARISQCIILCLSGSILIYSDERRYTFSFNILTSYSMSRSFRSYHDYVNIFLRLNLLIVNIESMGKHQNIAFLHVLFNLFFINLCLQFIRSQNHYQITSFSSFFNTDNFQACSFGFRSMCRARSQTNYNVNATFMQIDGMSMALASESDDGNGFTIQ